MMQQVIVYRNPVEAAFWNLITDTPIQFWVGLVVAFITFVIVLGSLEKISLIKKIKNRNTRDKVVISISGVFGILVFWLISFHLI